MKNIITIFLILILFSSLNSIDQIEYYLSRRFIGRLIDSFSVKFNRFTGIYAEYLEARNNLNEEEEEEEEPKGLKTYNITTDELGLPPLKELFKLFNKINFPNETDWMHKRLFDVPVWHLIVDDKDYYSNRGTEFLEKFDEIVNITNIKEYCISRY